MNKTIRFFTALLFLVAGLTVMALARRQHQNSGAPENQPAGVSISPALNWTPGDPIEHFTLTERTGQPFDSKSLEGKVWLANFFFASCPANCRKQTSRVAELEKEFGPDGVKFLSITVDPETDTPEALAGYARSFNADPDYWKFLTGDLTYITYIGREVFDVAVTPKGHSENLILVDQNGVVRGYYSWDDAVEIDQMKKTIRGLLDGSIAPAEKKARPAEPEQPLPPRVEEEAEDDAGPNATLESPQYEPAQSNSEGAAAR
jgi:cytochrome oxidase Cu insertion factor (SCO1/SenC/PrrC family)